MQSVYPYNLSHNCVLTMYVMRCPILVVPLNLFNPLAYRMSGMSDCQTVYTPVLLYHSYVKPMLINAEIEQEKPAPAVEGTTCRVQSRSQQGRNTNCTKSCMAKIPTNHYLNTST
ncbi:hypothetical protein AVEN_272374-1 [Araneus ventricosus]|uniref:Uncharacterized protein n=1 Tax=Araneus ventricosus TaxID=182803 RepID=A0A4Y2I0G2_ARAVE|nr:hypothetical protein AVEN_272374-1 [Araneus ventricosus]